LFPGFQLYGAIDNVTDVPPPVVASTTAVAGTGQGTIYDAIGRMFRAGIRLRY
jgi:outer membrane receptor protein involved in Fe transport